MLYKNKVTGSLLETACSISGGDWEPVPAPKKGGKPKGKDGAGGVAADAKKTGEDAPAEP